MISKPKENEIKISQQRGASIEPAVSQSVSAAPRSCVDSPVLEWSDQPLLCKQTEQSKDGNWMSLKQCVAPEQIN